MYVYFCLFVGVFVVLIRKLITLDKQTLPVVAEMESIEKLFTPMNFQLNQLK